MQGVHMSTYIPAFFFWRSHTSNWGMNGYQQTWVQQNIHVHTSALATATKNTRTYIHTSASLQMHDSKTNDAIPRGASYGYTVGWAKFYPGVGLVLFWC